METPLDVLSTLAVSIAETTEKTGDSVLGSGCPGLDSSSYDLTTAAAAAAASSKELPTRSLKTERLKERQDLAQVLHIDKDHAAAINARKTVVTAGTQTQFSSFNGEAPPYPGPPPGPPPAYFAPRGDAHSGDNYSPIHHTLYGPPPPLPPAPHTSSMSSSSPPSSSHIVDLTRERGAPSTDVQNAPLNLSISSSPLPAVSSAAAAWQPHRPSVITCKSSSSSPVSSGGSSPRGHSGHGANNGHASPSSKSPPVSDPAIEEHFRRSLASYGDSAPKTSPSSTAASESNVSITGSVDDHFAKALGDSTWKALKSQSDSAHEVFTGSVDDHFAKALGATTWRRIKAETEHSESSNINSTAANSGNTGNNNNGNSHSPSHSLSSSPSHSNSSHSAPVVT